MKSVTLNVKALFSDKGRPCVCCDRGKHRYATVLKFDNGSGFSGDSFIHNVARKLEDGQKIKVTVEIIQE